MLLQNELAGDDVDFLRLVSLPVNLPKVAMANITDPSVERHLVRLDDDAQLLLLARPVALLLWGRDAGRLLGAVVSALLGALSEEPAIGRVEFRLEAFELDLQRDAIFTCRREKLARQLHHLGDETAVLCFEE